MTVDRVSRCFALIVVATFTGLALAHAGGVNFGDDNDNGADQGPYFFGFVRDDSGSAVPDAKVTATVKAGGALVTRSNGMGVYKIPGFGKNVDPDSIDISCAKDGYKQDTVLRRPHAAGDNADPVEVECTLKKE
jgi:hypothetical protein